MNHRQPDPDFPERPDAERRVLDHFRNLPRLTFDRQATPLAFAFPAIHLQERSDRHATASPFTRFVAQATRRFHFQDFFRNDGPEVLCWAGEVLERDGGLLSVAARQPGKHALPNESPEFASDWFRHDVIDEIHHADDGTCRFLLGNPGTGKSTFFKYVVNRERHYALERGVVFSRFESSKFFRYVDTMYSALDLDAPFDGLAYARRMIVSFDHYYRSICLRDILFNYFCVINGAGRIMPARDGLAAPKSVYDTVERALAGSGFEAQIQDVFELVTDLIATQQFQFHKIFKLEPEITNRLLTAFVRRVERRTGQAIKMCVIYDGFDLLGPEDAQVAPSKLNTLKFILHTYGLWNPNSGHEQAFDDVRLPRIALEVPFQHHAFILLRQNTFDYLVAVKDRETIRRDARPIYLAPLSPDVILFKAFLRALKVAPDEAAEGQDAVEKANAIFNILTILLGRFRELVGEVYDPEEPGVRRRLLPILAIFDGNLRDCLDLVRRMLALLREEGEMADLLPRRPSIDDMIAFASASESINIARRRAYRAVELILFLGTPYFHNAMVHRDAPSVPSQDAGWRGGDIRRNHAFTGLVDNIFNYHCVNRTRGNEFHHLLINIRILQLLEPVDVVLSEAGIREAVAAMGYDTTHRNLIDDALVILRYTGAISIDPFSGNIFRGTARGRVLVRNFILSPNYLEHVFHKTLFPRVLLANDHDWTRRDNHEAWSVASIRNYFIFLSYIRFVEESAVPHDGGSITAERLITARMTKAVIDAVDRILEANRRDGRHSDPAQTIAARAATEIDAVMQRWRDNGVLANSDAELQSQFN
ncbi:MAG: hypothetical protein J0H01_17385 [Rhizobiales bacterium]|nr:hypothetical protein [Hyphomicrobiales bacterium]